jgi:hypothetical protein
MDATTIEPWNSLLNTEPRRETLRFEQNET